MQTLDAFFKAHQREFAEEATNRLIEKKLSTYITMDRETILLRVMQPGFQAFEHEFVEHQSGAFASYFGRIGTLRAQQGGHLDDVLIALLTAVHVMEQSISVAFSHQKDALIVWHEQMWPAIMNGAAAAARSYMAVKDQSVPLGAEQTKALRFFTLGLGTLMVTLGSSLSRSLANTVLSHILQVLDTTILEILIIEGSEVQRLDPGVIAFFDHLLGTLEGLGIPTILAEFQPDIKQSLPQLRNVQLVATLAEAVSQALQRPSDA